VNVILLAVLTPLSLDFIYCDIPAAPLPIPPDQDGGTFPVLKSKRRFSQMEAVEIARRPQFYVNDAQ